MSDQDKLIQALREAVGFSPDNVPLRKHLADQLFQYGAYAEAEKEYRTVLDHTPQDSDVKLALAEAFYYQQKWMVALVILEELMRTTTPPPRLFVLAARAYLQVNQPDRAAETYRRAVELDSALADQEIEALLPAAGKSPAPQNPPAYQPPPLEPDEPDQRVRIPVEDWPRAAEPELDHSQIKFDDVGGMDKVKDEIRIKIIQPLEHPDLYKAYGKSIGGGLLMYGPPGCGKTYLARATAGEVNAYFVSIGLHDVLNMYLGQSEHNLHSLFDLARRNKPCVLFIDEVDALGASRSDMRQSAGRHVINQFLSEMDGVEASNDGVLVLAASNAPWHIDSALRRPGRFDRVIFVPPPDQPARAAILRVMLKDKPVETLDFEQVAHKTDGFSGADLKGMVDAAVEDKLREAMKKGGLVPLTTPDLLRAARSIKPSTKDWFATARNYALYSNESGAYDDVLAYLRLDKDSGLFSKWRKGE
ncbi:MAG: AAA family ATPase [Chloroflexi bacterium]|nr:AAA family ATPase [Chloroflexota bacterium]